MALAHWSARGLLVVWALGLLAEGAVLAGTHASWWLGRQRVVLTTVVDTAGAAPRVTTDTVAEFAGMVSPPPGRVPARMRPWVRVMQRTQTIAWIALYAALPVGLSVLTLRWWRRRSAVGAPPPAAA